LGRARALLSLAGFAAPLASVAASAAMVKGFDVWRGDLGYFLRLDACAPLFVVKAGLLTGGLLVFSHAVSVAPSSRAAPLRVPAAFVGAAMCFLAAFGCHDGALPFALAALLASSAAFLLAYYAFLRTALPLLFAVALLALWLAHAAAGIPPGAAIPEAASLLAVLPFYAGFAFLSADRG